MREKIIRFMQGRYGNDRFNQFIMIAALLLCLFSLCGFKFGYILGIAGLAYAYYRMFSKDIPKRSAENIKYLQYVERLSYFPKWANGAGNIKSKTSQYKHGLAQRKTHHIYRCSSCKQKIRIPRGKGKVEITCPKCGNKFVKRS